MARPSGNHVDVRERWSSSPVHREYRRQKTNAEGPATTEETVCELAKWHQRYSPGDGQSLRLFTPGPPIPVLASRENDQPPDHDRDAAKLGENHAV